VLSIFANAATLLDLNAELLTHICDGLAATPPQRLSETFASAFIHVMPFFRIYTTYCKNYWRALEVLAREMEGNEGFRTFLHVCALKPETGRKDVGTFLIKPVQRICKYPLLFKDLLYVAPLRGAYGA